MPEDRFHVGDRVMAHSRAYGTVPATITQVFAPGDCLSYRIEDEKGRQGWIDPRQVTAAPSLGEDRDA